MATAVSVHGMDAVVPVHLMRPALKLHAFVSVPADFEEENHACDPGRSQLKAEPMLHLQILHSTSDGTMWVCDYESSHTFGRRPVLCWLLF